MRLPYRLLLLSALAVFPTELMAGSAPPDDGYAGPRSAPPDNGFAGPRPFEAPGESTGAKKGGSSSTVNIFYFDANYSIAGDATDAIEKILSVSTGSLRLERIESFLTYTNGNILILAPPEGLTRARLENGVSYEQIAGTTALDADRSLLVQYPLADADLNAQIVRHMRPVIAETRRVKILKGSAGGISFEAVSLDGKSPASGWLPTVAVSYYVVINGSRTVLTDFGRPMGLGNLRDTVKKRVNREGGDVLLSLSLRDVRGFDFIAVPPSRGLDYLRGLGTDIAAFDQGDFGFVWKTLTSPDYSRRAGDPVFLCSNIEFSSAPAAGLISAYAIRIVNGVKVGFLSLIPADSISRANAPGARVSVVEPVAAASELARELKAGGKADIIVVVSHLTPEELARLVSEACGIDVVIGPKERESRTRRKHIVELENWPAEKHFQPALVALRRADALGKISAVFSIEGGTAALKSLSEEAVFPEPEDLNCSDAQCGDTEMFLRQVAGRGDALLPDPRNIWPDLQSKLQYNSRDFFNLAAGILRKSTGAEAAFVRIRPFFGNLVGDISSGYVGAWLGPEERLVTAVMPGSALRQLASNFDFNPVEGGEWSFSRKYRGGRVLAVSGMDKTGRISGLPIADNEKYEVVFPEDILRDAEKYPGLKSAKVTGYSDSTYNKIVLDWLKAQKEKASGPGAQKDYEALVRELVENSPKNPSGWRINLRNAALQFVNTQAGNPDDFSGIADSRIRTVNQTLIQGSGKIFSEYYHEKIRIDTGLSADYGKVTLRPKNQGAVETESIDQILAENEFRYQAFKWNGFMGGAVLGPFANIAYDTEFTPQTNLPLRRIFRSRAGIKLFEGLRLQEFYFGGVTEQDYTFADTRTKYAWETGFKFNMPIPSTSFTFYAQGYYRDFTRSRFDNLSDIKNTLELNTKISAKLYGDVMLSPFLNYYRVTGKLTQGSAHNLTFGVSLEYARLFKLKH